MSYHARAARASEDLVAGLAYSIAYNYLQPPRARAQDRRLHLLPGRHRLQRRRGGRLQPDPRQRDHHEAAQRRDRRSRHGPPHPRAHAAYRLFPRPGSAAGILQAVDYTVIDFVCKGCSNECDVRQFTIEGEKTYWGDKCSDRYRKRAKVDKQPAIEDLVAVRQQASSRALTRRPSRGAPAGRRARPSDCRAAMYTFDRLPFWSAFFAAPAGGRVPHGGAAVDRACAAAARPGTALRVPRRREGRRHLPRHRRRFGVDQPGRARPGRRGRQGDLHQDAGAPGRSGRRRSHRDPRRDRRPYPRARRRHHRLGTRAHRRALRRRPHHRRDHRPQDRRRLHQPQHRPPGRHDLRDRRPGLQVHLHAGRHRGRLRHERSLRRRHRLVPRRAGREARHRHRRRVRRRWRSSPRRPSVWANAARSSWSAT